jgi:hypothetical protein
MRSIPTLLAAAAIAVGGTVSMAPDASAICDFYTPGVPAALNPAVQACLKAASGIGPSAPAPQAAPAPAPSNGAENLLGPMKALLNGQPPPAAPPAAPPPPAPPPVANPNEIFGPPAGAPAPQPATVPAAPCDGCGAVQGAPPAAPAPPPAAPPAVGTTPADKLLPGLVDQAPPNPVSPAPNLPAPEPSALSGPYAVCNNAAPGTATDCVNAVQGSQAIPPVDGQQVGNDWYEANCPTEIPGGCWMTFGNKVIDDPRPLAPGAQAPPPLDPNCTGGNWGPTCIGPPVPCGSAMIPGSPACPPPAAPVVQPQPAPQPEPAPQPQPVPCPSRFGDQQHQAVNGNC